MSPASVRDAIVQGALGPAGFRRALARVAPEARDAWLDRLLGLEELPADGPALPAGCVPYLPCSVEVVTRALELARVGAGDVFVDVGSGIGRTTILAHLWTGAAAVGIEIQPALVRTARAIAGGLGLERVTTLEGDATERVRELEHGTVLFLYCPFGADRVARTLDAIEPLALTRPLRLCAVDLPLPPRPWLTAEPTSVPGLTIHRSTPSAERVGAAGDHRAT